MGIKEFFANTPRSQLYLMLAVFGGGILAGWWFYLFNPAWAERDRLQGEVARLEQDLFQKRRIRQELPKLEAALKDLQRDLDQALSQLPEEKEIPSLLTQINRLGQEAGLVFTLFKPGKPIRGDLYTEIPIQMKAKGTYHALGRFLEKLSRMERIVNIANLKLAPAKARPGTKTASATIAGEFTATTFTFGGSKG
ncbi:MAG: type 4a pilus biogenesis protein PilO [Candidatus Methylomirabilales bacterium]